MARDLPGPVQIGRIVDGSGCRGAAILPMDQDAVRHLEVVLDRLIAESGGAMGIAVHLSVESAGLGLGRLLGSEDFLHALGVLEVGDPGAGYATADLAENLEGAITCVHGMILSQTQRLSSHAVPGLFSLNLAANPCL